MSGRDLARRDYAWRPVSCRTYGLPVRLGGEDLPPCRMCFVGATAAEACALARP